MMSNKEEMLPPEALQNPNRQWFKSFDWREFVCGCGAAFVNIGATYPIYKMIFRQILHGIKIGSAYDQIRHEGFTYLYRGIFPPLAQKTISLSIMFGVYDGTRRQLVDYVHMNHYFAKIVAGLVSGSVEAILLPFERVQTLLADSKFHLHFRNTADSFRYVYVNHGFTELYRGLVPVLLRNGPSNVLFFILREEALNRLPKQGKEQCSFEDVWPQMRPIVLKLLKQETVSQTEWQDLFYGVHLVCLWDEKGASKIYECLKDDIVEFIVQAQKRVQAQREEHALLKTYIIEWRKFFTQSSYLPLPFRQLETALQGKTTSSNNSSSNPQKKILSEESIVRKLMLDSWNENIFMDIKNRLQDSAMKIVHAERNGDAFDSQLVIGVRESYVNLCSNSDDKLEIYRDNFEAAYLKATAAFYRLKASEQQQTNGVQAFMRYADTKLREEEARAKRYLEPSSFHPLAQCCVNVLIGDHLTTLLAECAPLIKAGETERLQLMFRLLDRVQGGVDPMLRDLENHIVSAGLADMLAAADVITQDSEKYVERLLELFRRFSALVKEAFNDDPRFLTARDKAFKSVVNDTTVFKLELPTAITARGTKVTTPESKCPELLANYCDMLLRRTPLSKRLTSEQIESRLRDVLLVLKYVSNKDVFMRYHKVHLTRRLILDSSADSEKEEDMVEWLREVGMPADYVNKLARMFQDIKVSEDLNAQFRASTTRHDAINIKILNAGAWARCSERVSVSLPLELEDYIPDVEDFYKKKHSGRKLQWYHHMSNGTITFVNNVGRFDLDVTTFQMAVLFAWNQRPMEKVSYENLRLATELPDPELRRTLWSLVAFPKLKRQLLLMDANCTAPKDFTENTLFWVNQEFAIIKNGKTQRRGKLNLIGRLQLSTERSQQEDNQSIVQLRILRTQEAIIKIMKMRKRLNNAALQAELIDILKNMFLPSKKMIKEQLEWLIEHKYMRRDDDDINTFIYMA